MIELVVTVSMTAGSILLFGYWFRYTCLLILSAKTTRDYAGEVAAANHLSFLQIQTELRKGTRELDSLQKALDRDYEIVSRLLKLVSQVTPDESSVELRMLHMNYRLMRAWSSVSRRFSLELSRTALTEMSDIVAHFANAMGERTCTAAI